MQKTIEQFSDLELKAMKSDIYESNSQNNQNLQVINTELQKRARNLEANPPKGSGKPVIEEKTDDTNKEPEVSA